MAAFNRSVPAQAHRGRGFPSPADEQYVPFTPGRRRRGAPSSATRDRIGRPGTARPDESLDESDHHLLAKSDRAGS